MTLTFPLETCSLRLTKCSYTPTVLTSWNKIKSHMYSIWALFFRSNYFWEWLTKESYTTACQISRLLWQSYEESSDIAFCWMLQESTYYYPACSQNHTDILITTPMISYLIYAPTMQYGGAGKRTVKSEQGIWLVQTDLKGDQKRGPTRKRRECTCH